MKKSNKRLFCLIMLLALTTLPQKSICKETDPSSSKNNTYLKGASQNKATKSSPAENTTNTTTGNSTGNSTNTTAGQKDSSPLAPLYGGQMIYGGIGEPSNLIPYIASDAPSHEAASYLYLAPLKYDENLNITTQAAESYETLEDGKLLRFKLRKDIVWQDGVPLTADDMEFTYNLMVAKTTPSPYAEDFLAIKEFKKTGPYSFEVRYDKPFARALSTFMGAILPKHALEKENITSTPFSRNPIGCGPYILKDWNSGSMLKFEANTKYFEGRPYIDEIISRIIPDSATMFLELKANKLDFMGLSPQQYSRQTNTETWQKNFNKYKYLDFAYTYLGYNLNNPLFADKRVRQAIAHAIDKKGIIAGVLFGLGEPTIGPFKPGTWVYNNNIKDYDYNPQKAKELLAQAGYTDHDGDGIIDKDGHPFKFTILTNQGNSERIKIATIIQYQLEQVGIAVEVRMVEWAAFIEKFVQPRNFDAVILGWTITNDPDCYDVWHSSKSAAPGLNFVGFKNEETDKLLEEGRHTLDQNKRLAAYLKFQEIVHNEQPYCFLYVPYALPIVRSSVMGIKPAPIGISYNYEKWWINSKEGRPSANPLLKP